MHSYCPHSQRRTVGLGSADDEKVNSKRSKVVFVDVMAAGEEILTKQSEVEATLLIQILFFYKKDPHPISRAEV